ncbi:MAG TPA: glycosyltransferase family 2 protein [Roseiflexaceae bacterium]|nr:glycosyltransferase family 2 protein [Roseiflexaceae bacterium]HMP40686.1 glycosyltransferase family 2 protein [Roseiflexaceae bacterium]
MKLSLVIPCYNEADSIAQMHEQLTAIRAELEQRGPYELVFVDDGSTDATYELLTNAFATWEHVRIARHDRNRGLGVALRTGFANAVGEVIVVTDSDGTYPFTTIPGLLDKLTADVDIVTSSAYHPQGGVDGVPAYRITLSKGASLLYRLLVDWRIHTWTAMYRAYRREVVEQVPTTDEGYLVMSELLVGAIFAGYRVAEYPAILRVRRYGQSKAKIWKIIRSHLRFQAGIIWRKLTTPGRRTRRV